MARRGKPGLMVGILLGVSVLAVGAIIVIGQIREPVTPPGADPSSTSTLATTSTVVDTTTTTTPSLVQETGVPLSWETVLDLDDEHTIGLVEYEDSMFLFTARDHNGLARGLRGWVSTDGADWTATSELDDSFVINSVISIGSAIIAYGSNPQTGDALVWRSEDGIVWDEVLVSPGQPLTTREFAGAASTEDLTVIIELRRPDPILVRRRVIQAINDHFGHPNFYYLTESADLRPDSVLPLFAFGIPVGSTTPAELGLTASDLASPVGDQQVIVWSSPNGVDWTETIQPEWHDAYRVGVGVDGRVQVDVTGVPFVSIMTSDDGVTWSPFEPQDEEIWAVEEWSGGLVGSSRRSRLAYFSADGTEWRAFNFNSFLTNVPEWSLDTRAVGEVGIALVTSAHDGFGPFQHPEDDEPPEWSDGEYRVVAPPGFIDIYRNDDLVLSIALGHYEGTAHGRYDHSEATLTFLDPSTGVDLVTIPVEDFNQLGRPGSGSFRGHLAFLFSSASTWPTPGSIDPLRLPRDWTVQDMAPFTSRQVTNMAIVGDRIVLIASGPGWVTENLGFGTEVLVAPIPED